MDVEWESQLVLSCKELEDGVTYVRNQRNPIAHLTLSNYHRTRLHLKEILFKQDYHAIEEAFKDIKDPVL